MKKVDILFGMQFGSEGKGLIAGHLGMTGIYDTVISTNMPNAGHTYIIGDREYMFKVLPNSAIGDHVEHVLLGPDAVFSEDRLLKEIEMCGPSMWSKLKIHECAVPMSEEHTRVEKESLLMERIGSTAQGSCIAMIDKIRRLKSAPIMNHLGPLKDLVISHEDYVDIIHRSNMILLEGAQGYSLGLNAGFYPYCTSRDCNPTRLAAGAAVPYNWIRNVIGAMRVHPIRVGGNSGPGYEDQAELTWADIGQEPEYTTVTQRERRVFEWSKQQTIMAVKECQPNQVFLNFCNYDPELSKGILRETNTILKQYGPAGAAVKYTGWGPTDADIRYENGHT